MIFYADISIIECKWDKSEYRGIFIPSFLDMQFHKLVKYQQSNPFASIILKEHATKRFTNPLEKSS
jgi:hypothetical protein